MNLMPVRPRVLFFGAAGQRSRLALEALLAGNVPIAAVVVPRPRLPAAPAVRRLEPAPASAAELPLLAAPMAPDVVDLAWSHCIPALAAGPLTSPDAHAALAATAPDLLCVACFPYLLPRDLLALAPLGGLNLHPSLLPAHRGPAPLFWTFRSGDPEAGVTVHWLDEGFDTGPIALQERVRVPEGITGEALGADLAGRGARLLARAIQALTDGELPRIPQDTWTASYHSWPAAADWEVTGDWPARRAFNFLRGVAGGGRPVIRIAGQQFSVGTALGYEPAAHLGAAWRADGDELLVQCTPGVLRVRLTARSPAAPPSPAIPG
jgi:methionyl-tRNA formyltransferase